MRPCLSVAIVLAIACDRPADPAPVATAPTKVQTPDAKTPPEPSTPTTPTKPTAPTVTKEMRAEYHAHLEKGRKLSKAGDWAEAIEELEAALDVFPGDDRAMGELSWAAFSSGDHAKAREMAHAAALAATSPKVKAAALYNLGRAEEASGRIAEARTAYTESIALRPNKTVAQRLAALDQSASVAEHPCATPQSEPLVCECLMKSVTEPDVEPDCTLEPTGNSDFKIATYATSDVGERNVMVVARQPTGWAVVAELASVYNPGMMGISEELTLGEVESTTLGTHTIVEIGAHKSRSDTDLGIDEIETEETEMLVVCVVGDATIPTKCPLELVIHHVYQRERLGMADEGEEIDKSMQTPGLPIQEETRISVEYTEHGTAKLRAEMGKVAADDLGDRKLW
jgi:hypothetical protein